MHPNRRRKKRSNYGLRTVEVVRGPNGFGFTISGQQPCILSCIVANSPADQAGLRAGDFLISVNGMSVSKSTHDFVVNLIGTSVGPIKMTIAENYYSDSSDEDFDVTKISNRKPKYKVHNRSHRHEASNGFSNRIDLSSPIKKIMRLHNINTPDISNVLPREIEDGPIEYKVLVGYLGTIEMPKQVVPSARLKTVCSCIRKLRQEKRTPTVVLMTVLPTCLTLKNATNQILAIYPTSRVVYISSSTDKDLRYFGLVTSAICDNRMMDTVEKRDYLNIDSKHVPKAEKCNNNVEDRPEIEISNSCHVFMTDPKIVEHLQHLDKAEHFKITCTKDIVTGSCLEFPKNALYIVSLVQNMYKLQDSANDRKNNSQYNNDDHLAANSPQPSASSNSDSGIGFRDDCGNISDRIVVVEFPAQQPMPIIPSSSNRPSAIDASDILLENLDIPFNNGYKDINNIRCRKLDLKCSISDDSNKENKHLNNLNNVRAYDESSKAVRNISNTYTNRLTVRTMADPHSLVQYCDDYRNANIDTGQIFTERAVDVPSNSFCKKISESIVADDITDFKSSVDNVSVDNISVHSTKSLDMKHAFKTPSTKYVENRKCTRRQLKMLGSYDNLIVDSYTSNHKLSPKVYGLSKPNYSFEELAFLEGVEKCGFGSLQDLSTLASQNRAKRNIAQSEPDVRIPRQQDYDYGKDESGTQHSKESESVAAWATSFEKLLEDPVGLQTFAEFLKKEFSAENIYFWTSCERFRHLPTTDRILEAQRIHQRHLCVGASEPVNIDSHARQFSEQSLQVADPKLFEQAQKQIFNLMKFDSYPRFLKSELYKRCLAGHVETSFDSGLLLQPLGITPSKLKKSLSNAEDRRRKSLLPWHRKNRSKSKDRDVDLRGEKKEDNLSDDNVHSSKSSLTSQESAEHSLTSRGPLCRVILNNGSTTVVQIREGETIQQLVNRVLDKRGLNYSSFEVYTDKHPKVLNVADSSTYLAGCEVRIEQRVVFKLDLPNRKVIAVKSKCTKLVIDVLKPILNKYNYHLDQVTVKVGCTDFIDIMLPVTSIDGMRLNIQPSNEFKEQPVIQGTKLTNKVVNPHSLDEITNKVFKELLHEKADLKNKLGSDRGSVKSDDWESENSSGILGRFLRRDSGVHEKKKKCVGTRIKGNSNHSSIEDLPGEHSSTSKKPLIAKWKSGVNKLHVSNCSDSEKLYEGLNRAQNSRIEDQRGTEINFELPDFLKDKENGQYHCNRLQKIRHGEGTVAETIKLYDGDLKLSSNYENRNIVAPTNTNNGDHCNRSAKLNNIRTYPTTENSKANQVALAKPTIDVCSPESPKCGEPPPLPPKPKILPIRPSNWGHQNGLFKVPKTPRNEATKSSLFLDQPTSSFV